MFQFLQKLFDTKDFLPLGQCFSWQKDVLITNLAGDSIIALLYFAVPFILYTLSRRRTFVIDKYIFVVFSLFIWVCALRHVLNIIIIWEPVYYLQGVFKLITSFLALFTVFTMPLSISLRMINGLNNSAPISFGKPHSCNFKSGPTTITERPE